MGLFFFEHTYQTSKPSRYVTKSERALQVLWLCTYVLPGFVFHPRVIVVIVGRGDCVAEGNVVKWLNVTPNTWSYVAKDLSRQDVWEQTPETIRDTQPANNQPTNAGNSISDI